MSSPENPGYDVQATATAMQGILLSGEGLASMTSERLAMLGEMVGGLGLQLTVMHEGEQLPMVAEVEAESVVATKEELIAFAVDNGYSMQAFRTAWHALANANDEYPEYPPIKFFDLPRFADSHVDLRSVYDRLRATGIPAKLGGWPIRVGVKSLTLLARFVNERVQPDEAIDVGDS